MKNGFTLIELLAVIIILSIVALISVPIVSGVLESGRVGAIENSAEFYIKEIEKAYAEWIVEGIPVELKVDNAIAGYDKLDVSDLNKVLRLKGKMPLSGNVLIDSDYYNDNSRYGFVIEATLVYGDGYQVNYTYEDGKNNIQVEKNNLLNLDS